MPGAKVFVSYSHKDHEYLERLRTHLDLIQSQYAVEIWDDTCISAGNDWKTSIDEAISSADLYICLISVDFFASEFIREREIPLLLKALETGKRLLPIYVGPLGLDEHPFCRLQGLNAPDRPLQSMGKAEREAFCAETTRIIRDVLQSICETPPFEVAAELIVSRQAELKQMIIPTPRREYLSVAKHDRLARYNIVLIGQTGVGKSELLNYLFGKPLRETGVGKPVTDRGFHKQPFALKGVGGNLCGNLFDSWGLEVGKHEEWQNELAKELSERGTDKPADAWFHTILFCVDASGARIQPFEVDIIQKFIYENYNVIIVLTKSDVTSAKKRAELRNAIRAVINTDIPCIEVGSKEEELAIGKTQQFGAEQLMEQMSLSFWDSVAKRLPSRCCFLLDKEIDVWLLRANEYLETQTGWFNQKRIAEHLQKDFKHLNEGLFCTDGLFEHIFLKELSNVVQVYFNVHGILRVPMEVSVSATADRMIETAKFSERLSRAFAESRSFEDILVDSFPHLFDFISALHRSGILRLGPVAAIGVGIGALVIGLVKVGSVVSNLPGKEAFKEAMLNNLETASAEMKIALHQLEPELEGVIREKILPQTALLH